MDQNCEAVFFCSAFNDISFILAEIEYKKCQKSLIYVTNNFGVFQFLQKLNVTGMELEFLETKLKNNINPIHWFIEFCNLNFRLYYKFKAIKNKSVYFYATYYDTLSMYAIGQLKNKNKLYLGFLPEPDEFIHSRRRLYDKIISILYQVPINTYKSVGIKVSGLSQAYLKNFIIKGRRIPSSELINIQNNYAYQLKDDKTYILLLSSEEDDGIANVYSSAKDIFLYILNHYKLDELCIKAHPRVGPASFLMPFKIREMPVFVPIEFLNLSNCKLAIGINSIALANIASRGKKVVSIMNLMSFYSEEIRSSYIKYLEVNSFNNSISYPKTMDELQSILKNA
jgi:hypothetical protein